MTQLSFQIIPGAFWHAGIKGMLSLSLPIILTSVDFLEGKWEVRRKE